MGPSILGRQRFWQASGATGGVDGRYDRGRGLPQVLELHRTQRLNDQLLH